MRELSVAMQLCLVSGPFLSLFPTKPCAAWLRVFLSLVYFLCGQVGESLPVSNHSKTYPRNLFLKVGMRKGKTDLMHTIQMRSILWVLKIYIGYVAQKTPRSQAGRLRGKYRENSEKSQERKKRIFPGCFTTNFHPVSHFGFPTRLFSSATFLVHWRYCTNQNLLICFHKSQRKKLYLVPL